MKNTNNKLIVHFLPKFYAEFEYLGLNRQIDVVL